MPVSRPAANSIAAGGCVKPTLPGKDGGKVRPVEVKASEKNSGLNIQTSGDTLTLSGEVKPWNTRERRFARFEVDGKPILVPLSFGMKPAELMKSLGRQLPDGYAVQALPTTGQPQYRIVRTTSDTPNDPKVIKDGFAAAQKSGSHREKKVSARELGKLVASAKQDGFTAQEKRAFARSWVALFDGAGYRATPAAQKLYARLAERHDLPIIPHR